MLCDSHIHFIPEKLSAYTAFYKGSWADKHALYAYLDKQQIERALLVYPSTDAQLKLGSFSQVCAVYNEALEKVIKENPKIIGAGIVDLDSLLTIDVQV